MKKMKVLVIVNAIFGYDGISNVATNYYLYQDKSRVAMDLLTINPVFDNLTRVIKEDGNQNFVLQSRNKNPFAYILALFKIIKKNKYDIVHVHGNSATMAVELLAAKLAGCKVRIAHSHNTQCDHVKLNKLLMPLFSRLYTHCCACSKEAGEFLFGDRDCYVVNNGLYLPKYAFDNEVRERIRKENGLEDKFVIGHIGRFRFQKNQEYLVSLLKQIQEREKDAVLLLVGEGETEAAVKKQAEELGLDDSVIFYGTTDCVNEVVQAMDVFAFPSRFEGLGIVAIEAQAAGLNCVASDAVPRTIKIMDQVSFHNLEDQDARWINDLIAFRVTPKQRNESRADTIARLQTNGFDIEKNCLDLLHHYAAILAAKGIRL